MWGLTLARVWLMKSASFLTIITSASSGGASGGGASTPWRRIEGAALSGAPAVVQLTARLH